MSKRLILGIIGALVLLIGWWSFHHRASSDQPGSTATAGTSGRRGGTGAGGGPVPVVAGKVEQKDTPIYLDGLGTVQAFNTVTVHTRVDGELQQVLFTEGQDVKTGDLLAVIDPRPFQAALDQAIAKKAQDEAQLANAKVTLARNTDRSRRSQIYGRHCYADEVCKKMSKRAHSRNRRRALVLLIGWWSCQSSRVL